MLDTVIKMVLGSGSFQSPLKLIYILIARNCNLEMQPFEKTLRYQHTLGGIPIRFEKKIYRQSLGQMDYQILQMSKIRPAIPELSKGL